MSKYHGWIKSFLIASSVFLAYSLSLHKAPAQGLSKRVIADVRVEGNVTSDEDLVIITSGLSKGTTFSSIETFQDAIKRLWKIDVFEDIAIEGEYFNPGQDSIHIIIQVKEYPRLEEVQVEGTKEIKEKDIKKKLGIFISQTVSPTRIKRAKRKIKDLYAEEGYRAAEVEITSYKAEDKENRVILKIKIDEGPKVKIKKITFHGNKAFSEGKLRGNLGDIKQKALFRSGEFDPKKFVDGKAELLNFYKKKGHRDAQIKKDSIYYGENKKDLFIDIWVKEGPQYKIGQVTWSGNKLYSDLELNAVFGLKEGDNFNQEKYEKALQERIQGLYYDKGYLYANITPIEVPVGDDTLNIDFLIAEGEPVAINEVIIEGNTKTSEKVIRRELYSLPGETFSREALIRSQSNLFVLNYFANIVPDVVPVGQDKVNVVFTVEEKSTDTANLSVGYSAQEGFIGGVGFTFNNFDIKDPLHGGAGQRLSFNWQFGRSDFKIIQLSFTEPWFLDTRTLVGFSVFYINEGGQRAALVGYESIRRGGSIQVGRRFHWPDDFFRGSWSASFSQVEQTPLSISPQNLAFGKSNRFALNQAISRDSRNSAEFPTNGSVYTLGTELGLVAYDTVGFNNTTRFLPKNYYKLTFKGENYIPTVWKLILYTSTEVGYVDAFRYNSDIREIPTDDRFYMGGGGLQFNTIQLRGYGTRRIGERDVVVFNSGLSSSSFAVGGATMVKYAAELRVPIVPNPTIFALGFAEAGNVYSGFSVTDPFDVKRSVGLGFRIFLPLVGIIGLDWGYGIDNRPGNKAHWHFQLGQQF